MLWCQPQKGAADFSKPQNPDVGSHGFAVVVVVVVVVVVHKVFDADGSM
jgi:hypothetical protein